MSLKKRNSRRKDTPRSSERPTSRSPWWTRRVHDVSSVWKSRTARISTSRTTSITANSSRRPYTYLTMGSDSGWTTMKLRRWSGRTSLIRNWTIWWRWSARPSVSQRRTKDDGGACLTYTNCWKTAMPTSTPRPPMPNWAEPSATSSSASRPTARPQDISTSS